MVYVYGLRLDGNDEYRYIGSTHIPKSRLWLHKYRPAGNPNKYEWIQANRDSVVMDILENVADDSDPRQAEQEWITKLSGAGHRLLNVRRADEGTPFSRLSDEEKNRVIGGYLDELEGDSMAPWKS